MELLVVGGDKRHAALCELARARGWHVMSMGLPGSLPCAGLADAAVLPMPYAREGRVPAPLLSDAPDIVSVLEHVRPGARVYCGGADEALNTLAQEKRLKIIDLYKDEAFARRGALPSAEGATCAASMRERDEMVAGAHVLIVGFGRLGQALALMLTGMGAHAARGGARREESRALADARGLRNRGNGRAVHRGQGHERGIQHRARARDRRKDASKHGRGRDNSRNRQRAVWRGLRKRAGAGRAGAEGGRHTGAGIAQERPPR